MQYINEDTDHLVNKNNEQNNAYIIWIIIY